MSQDIKKVKISAGFVIYRLSPNENTFQLLLVNTPRRHDHWTPPKGHIERGESELDAAYRETMEETGLLKEDIIVIDGFREDITYTKHCHQKQAIYYMAELKQEKPIVLSNEHESYVWADPERAIEITRCHKTGEVIQHACHFIRTRIK